ncbi:hypothetical protein LTR05_004316 [Lithohypha guttulata]|uniref:HMG box domain-containing protein n=1 Tax=Lithohypha guttulata TaxID=1690604 RepID=A0AAN7Y7N1_9EURO|nr:hypothetical protein LTR05_004316 [Lithohypha guttulata]
MAKTKAEPEAGTVNVNIADFQRTRDSVIVALATLQSSVKELSKAYINHANTVLAPGKVGSLDSNLTEVLTESNLLGGGTIPGLTAPQDVAEEGKKKRKRAPHDPNAPKRALTPYFLYMQNARAQIHRELGDQARPKEVADEGTRRWGDMSAAEKSIWDDKYQKNLAAYRVRMAAYKAGQPVPSEEEALHLVEAGKAPEHVPGIDGPEESEVEEAAAPVEEVAVAAEESEEEDSPEPEKEPTPPKSKRRKSDKKVEETPKETPKTKGKERKAKKEATPPPAAKPASEKRKKTRKG